MGRFLHYSDFLAVKIADYRGFRDYTDSKIRVIRFICLIRDSDIFPSIAPSPSGCRTYNPVNLFLFFRVMLIEFVQNIWPEELFLDTFWITRIKITGVT